MPPPGVVGMGTGGRGDGGQGVRTVRADAIVDGAGGSSRRASFALPASSPWDAAGALERRMGVGAGATRASVSIGAEPNVRGFDAREGGCGAIAYLAWGRRAAWSGAEIPRAPSGRRRPRGRQPPGWRRWPSLLSRACGEANGAAREERFRFVRRASERERCARRCQSVCGAPSPRRRSATFEAIKKDVHVRRGFDASRAFEDPTVSVSSNRAGYFLTDRTRTPLSSDRSNAVVRSTPERGPFSRLRTRLPLLSSRSKSSSSQETESAARGARAASRDRKRAQNVTMKIEEVQSTTKRQRVATHTHIKVSPTTIASAIGTSDPRTGTLIIDFDLLRTPDRSTRRRVKRAHV